MNLIMRRLSVLFALCSNRAAFQDSVLVKWHLSSPRWKLNGRRSCVFVKTQRKEQHSYSCYGAMARFEAKCELGADLQWPVWLWRSFKSPRVLVRFDHVARFIVNANHGIM